MDPLRFTVPRLDRNETPIGGGFVVDFIVDAPHRHQTGGGHGDRRISASLPTQSLTLTRTQSSVSRRWHWSESISERLTRSSRIEMIAGLFSTEPRQRRSAKVCSSVRATPSSDSHLPTTA